MSINNERAAAGFPGWPTFAEAWFGETTTYPFGRTPQQRRPLSGWVCSGCGSGYAPHVRRCEMCGPDAKAAKPAAREMGEWEDEK